MRKFLIALFGCLLLVSISAMAQKVVTGKVTDSRSGLGLSGVTVSVKGSSIATSTDNTGSFSITAPSASSILVFSYVGYGNTESSAKDAVVNIILSESAGDLSEVVVTGYGSQIKRELTGNIARVKGSEIANVPVPNFTQALQGRAAGVFVESQSGKVGEAIKVRVRGTGSLSAGNEPLYVVDGIPLETGTITGNALADINFNDVESFDILKDASAAAIYGARGANGVVLITTKKGKAGKTTLNVGAQYGISSPTNYRGFMNAEEYVDYFRMAGANGARYHFNRDGNFYNYANEQEAIDDWVGFVEGRLRRYSGWSDYTTNETNTDWERLAFKKANTSAIDVTASGGNEKTRFYLSGSYNKQEGILIGNDFERITARLNVDHEVNNYIKIGANLSIARTERSRVPDDNEFSNPLQLVALAPITPPRNLDGVLYDRPTTTYYNALIEVENSTYKSIGFRNLATLYGEVKLAQALKFRSEVAADIYNETYDVYNGSRSINGLAVNGFGQNDFLRNVNVNTNNYFNYNKIIRDRHTVDATVGMAFQQSDNATNFVTGNDFPVDDLRNLASAGTITGGSSAKTQYSFLSYFARANYKFDDKYLLSVSGRVDGSSRFGRDSRYGFFPSVSGGWVLSEESFLKSSSFLNFLKLRASWGLSGNAEIGNFPQLGLWGASKYNLASALVPTQLANPNLKWEKSNQTNIGLDFSILNSKLSGEIDYYVRKTDDLLYNLPVPGTSGFTTVTSNIGAMENRGFEFVLNSTNVQTRDFKWSTSANIAFNRNKIVRLDGETNELPGNDGRFLNSLIVGQPIGVFYGPRYAGVDPANGDGLFFTEDGRGTTNNYNQAGDFIVGDPNPDFIYGLTNIIGYKGFELNVLFQGVHGNQIMNGAGGFMSPNGDWFDNHTRDQLNSWKQPGDITMVPEARLNLSGSVPNAIGASSRYVEDGSYLRLKTASLSYNLPASLLQRMKISSARFYVTGQNLLTFTKYTGWDPEVNADYRSGNRNQGSDFYSAPQIKSVVFGLNIGL